MTRAVAAAVVLLSLPAGTRQVFRAGTDVVLLSVTVTDAQGRFVPGLDREDFLAYEDGMLQDISNFSRDPQPVALSLLVDTSMSMEKKLQTAQQAAIGLIGRLGPRDIAQVVTFDSRPSIALPFTSDKDALERAIRHTEAGGSTSLYTAIYIAMNALTQTRMAAPDQLRHQAIVLLSDGEDTSSSMDLEQVLDLSKRSDVSVYAVGLRSKQDRPAHGFNEAEYFLRTLTQETGGHAFFVSEVTQLPGLYQQIADELANQYTLGYTSKNLKRDGAWRRIVVRTTRTGVTARTKSGYFGPTVAK
jgi:Ca-activated chloride channel family protein